MHATTYKIDTYACQFYEKQTTLHPPYYSSRATNKIQRRLYQVLLDITAQRKMIKKKTQGRPNRSFTSYVLERRKNIKISRPSYYYLFFFFFIHYIQLYFFFNTPNARTYMKLKIMNFGYLYVATFSIILKLIFFSSVIPCFFMVKKNSNLYFRVCYVFKTLSSG